MDDAWGLPSQMDDDFRPKTPEGLAREAVERRQQRMAMGIQVATCRGDRHLMPMDEHAGFQQLARFQQNVYVDRYVGT